MWRHLSSLGVIFEYFCQDAKNDKKIHMKTIQTNVVEIGKWLLIRNKEMFEPQISDKSRWLLEPI